MVLAALSAMILITSIGMSVDVARGLLVRGKLQTAIDSAGLAGGTVLRTNEERIKEVTERYFEANFPDGYMDVQLSDLNINVNDSNEKLQVSVTATMDTLFVRLMGIDYFNVGVGNEISKELNTVEVALVLDQTGSMRHNDKMESMKDSAKKLVEIIYDETDYPDRTFFSVIPYVAAVNIGNEDYKRTWLYPYIIHERPFSWGLAQYCDVLRPDGSYWMSGYSKGFLDNYEEVTGHDFEYFNSDENLLYYSTGDIQDGSTDLNNPYFPTNWKGCVEARVELEDASRSAPASSVDDVWRDTTDDPPDGAMEAGLFRPYLSMRCSAVGNSNNWGPEYFNDWPPRFEAPDYAGNHQEPSVNGDVVDGPNRHCGDPLLPLTNVEDDIVAHIDSLVSWEGGGTLTNMGIVWGWRNISHRWQNLWDSGSGLPHDPGFGVKKIMVVLTDGANQFWPVWPNSGGNKFDPTAYGRLDEGVLRDEEGQIGRNIDYGSAGSITEHRKRGRQEINKRTLEVCENVKAQGITIYTITFDIDSIEDADAQDEIRDVFRNCATNNGLGYYFDSPDNETLELVFEKIARSIAKLRISK